MTLVKGVNCGFVSTAPTEDPNPSVNYAIDGRAIAIRDYVPSGVTSISEIGFWCNVDSEEANFEVAIYNNSGIDRPDYILVSSDTNAKGTSAGWKKATGLNIPVTAGVTYWIAVQLDNTATTTRTGRDDLVGARYSDAGVVSTLPNPWSQSGSDDYIFSIYAVTEGGAAYDTKVGTGGQGSKYIKTNWPVESGLTSKTTKQTGRHMSLVPEKSFVTGDKEGI